MANQLPKFEREFTAEQLKGKYHLNLYPEALNQAFLDECRKWDRAPADLLRIILKERYTGEEIHYPLSVDVSPKRKRDVA
jgi:hypothetical protein